LVYSLSLQISPAHQGYESFSRRFIIKHEFVVNGIIDFAGTFGPIIILHVDINYINLSETLGFVASIRGLEDKETFIWDKCDAILERKKNIGI
jgi:hypothetical protein